MSRRLVPMASRHLEEVLAIEEAGFATPWTAAQFLSELSGHSHAVNQVALDAPGLVRGFLCAWKVGDELRVHTVAVDPGHRREGWASFILEAALRVATDQGCSVATLEVRRSNLPALALYRKIGFVEVGCRKAYYPSVSKDGQEIRPVEDAVLMDCELPPISASKL